MHISKVSKKRFTCDPICRGAYFYFFVEICIWWLELGSLAFPSGQFWRCLRRRWALICCLDLRICLFLQPTRGWAGASLRGQARCHRQGRRGRSWQWRRWWRTRLQTPAIILFVGQEIRELRKADVAGVALHQALIMSSVVATKISIACSLLLLGSFMNFNIESLNLLLQKHHALGRPDFWSFLFPLFLASLLYD